VALLTGASSGLPLRALARGAKLVIASRAALAGARTTRRRRGRAEACVVDCASLSRWRLVQQAETQWGWRTSGGNGGGPCHAADPGTDSKTPSPSPRLVLWLCQMVVPGMRKRGWGRIVASTRCRHTAHPQPGAQHPRPPCWATSTPR
jgi:NAD(P)-dependent dehydrogenase (short-subunit alcohol dehydrogenase family)